MKATVDSILQAVKQTRWPSTVLFDCCVMFASQQQVGLVIEQTPEQMPMVACKMERRPLAEGTEGKESRTLLTVPV